MHANFTAEAFLGRLWMIIVLRGSAKRSSSAPAFGDPWRQSISIQTIAWQRRIIVTHALPGYVERPPSFSLARVTNRLNETKRMSFLEAVSIVQGSPDHISSESLNFFFPLLLPSLSLGSLSRTIETVLLLSLHARCDLRLRLGASRKSTRAD